MSTIAAIFGALAFLGMGAFMWMLLQEIARGRRG